MEWSPVQFVIIQVINEIEQLQSGSLICWSQVWLQTELDNKKSCYQLIMTISISQNKYTWNKYLQWNQCLQLKIPSFWKFPSFSENKWLLLGLFWSFLWLMD